MPVTPDVRIGIVSWNTAELLDRALASLPDALGDLSAEVVVVDNASSDLSVDVAHRHRGVRVVVNDSNVGYARAMNSALADTEARALIALNPDTEAAPGSLATLVATLDERPRAGLVAPTLLDSAGAPQQSVFPYPGFLQALEVGFVPTRWRRADGHRRHDQIQTLRNRWTIGAVHCIRRAALGTQLPYSTQWFMYVEDLELCWRLERDGWSNLLHRGATVVHHGNAAGVQRWGDGAELELRSLPNIYDWLWSSRSPLEARATALANVVGTGMKSLTLDVGAAATTGARAERLKGHAAELRRLALYHRTALRAGRSIRGAGSDETSRT